MAEIGEPLSERELAVLECLVDGSTNREIAQTLHISPNTVKVHLRNIFMKLGVSSRTEATAVALQKGLLSLPGLETTADSEEEEDEEPLAATVGETAESEVTVPQPEPLREPTTPIAAGPKPEPSHRWRNLSLALGGLLLIVLLVFVGLQFLERANSDETPIEMPIGDTRWFTSRGLPEPISNMALATIGLNLYQIGGEVEAGVVNLVNIYETDSGRWMPGAAKTTAVADATAAVLFGEIYVPGGRLADGQPTSVVEAYSPANNAWRPITPLPKPISGGLVLSDGNLLYLLGGWDGEEYLTDVYVYDSSSESWQTMPSMSAGRGFAAGGILDGKIFVVGGKNERGELAICEFFESDSNVWRGCPEMSRARAGAGSAVLINRWLYVIGGGLETQAVDSEVYNVEFASWQSVEMPMLENESWANMAVANIESRIFVFGGRQGEAILDDGYVFSPFVHQTFLPAVGADE